MVNVTKLDQLESKLNTTIASIENDLIGKMVLDLS